MNIRANLWLILLFTALIAQAGWRVARPGWEYTFPRDHGSHPGYKTEWWYFTGNFTVKDGREFGYQITFFRQGILDGSEDIIPLSRFVTRDVKFAHFTVTDLAQKKFHFFQKLSRGAYGEAGFDDPPRLAWIDGWTCELTGENTFSLRAAKDTVSIDLRLRAEKSPVIHGKDGISRKAEGGGRASHYYSLTRLATEGSIRIGGKEFSVTGQSWFDHEWATNQLAENQAGWDWFSLQFDDGSELMLFQLRDKDGARDPFSSGTFIDAAGKTISISDFTLQPGNTWTSPVTKGRYPIAWKITVPSLALNLDLRATLKDQELRLQPVNYWEGAIRAEGTRANKPITARGYLEMTGYTGPIAGMQTGK